MRSAVQCIANPLRTASCSALDALHLQHKEHFSYCTAVACLSCSESICNEWCQTDSMQALASPSTSSLPITISNLLSSFLSSMLYSESLWYCLYYRTSLWLCRLFFLNLAMNIPDIPLLLESRIVPVRWGDNGDPSVAAPVREDSMVGQAARDRDREGK